MIRFASMWLFAVVLAGCATIGNAANLPSGDTRHWLTYRVGLGDQVLQFSVPPGVDDDFMDQPVPQRIDLHDASIFDETGTVGVITRHWDYRKNVFSPILGTLVASVGLGYSEQPLNDLAALQEAVGKQRDLVQVRAIARDPKYSGPPTPPLRFDPVEIAGRDALYVSYRFLPSSYVVRLDAHHYLGIGVRNGVSPGTWREDAQGAADAILKSIRIEPRH